MSPFNTETDELKKIEKDLKKKLDKKRFAHTKGVAYTAACMAMSFGVDLKKAYLAGLLHDNAKCLPNDEKVKLAKKFKLKLNKAEKSNPDLLHAKLGSKLAEANYEIADGEVLSSIEWHTTGKPEMTELEKIIYIADYIEPNRKPLEALDEARQMAFKDLNKTMVIILESTLNYLKNKDATIDEQTVETYEYYKKLVDTK